MSITSNKLCWMGALMLAAVSGTAQAGVSLDRTRLIITGKEFNQHQSGYSVSGAILGRG